MSFYDDEKDRLISEVIRRRNVRGEVLDKIVDIKSEKLTRDQISRLKLYLDTTLEDEQIVSNRLWGKPVERTQEVEKCLILDN